MIRRHLHRVVVASVTAALTVSAAWAGTAIPPVGGDEPVRVSTDDPSTTPPTPLPEEPEAQVVTESGTAQGVALEPGRYLVGASRVSLEPRPEEYGGTWDTENCTTVGEDALAGATHVADFRVRWPENPDCIYMGGYGIGPMNPVTSWDQEHGLHVRSVAIGDGADTAVITLIDAVSFFADYERMCPEGDRCGADQLAEDLGAELGIDPAGLQFISTHSHTAPDLIGGWGGVPDWYMAQVADAIREAVRQAVGSMQPATVEVGETIDRRFNAERRDFYRSAEDPALAWFRAYVPGMTDPAGEQTTPHQVIATVGAYAAHPVTADAGTGTAHADFPGVFATRVEEVNGGVGMLLQTGLGNMSPRGSTDEIGTGLAALVPPAGSGRTLATTDVRSARTSWDHPVTNSALTALGMPGFFDRTFSTTPAEVTVGENPARACHSASPVSVRVSVNATAIGDGLVITGAPGETFANLSNTIKEKFPGGVALPLAQSNDGLGYLMQSFETDHAGRQGVGFVGEVAEYEDAYSIDHCFGDAVLENTLGLLNELR